MQIGFAYLISFLYSYHAFEVTGKKQRAYDVYTQVFVGYWLLKTEPGTYSYNDLLRDNVAVWDGVSNNLALQNIRLMKKGDLAFIYHSGDEKAIVGIAEVAKDPYADPLHKNSKRSVVELKAKRQLDTPVTLAQVKSRKEFAEFGLVRNSRLSVMPVSDGMWKTLIALSRQ